MAREYSDFREVGTFLAVEITIEASWDKAATWKELAKRFSGYVERWAMPSKEG